MVSSSYKDVNKSTTLLQPLASTPQPHHTNMHTGEHGPSAVYYVCSDFHGRPMGKLCPVEKKGALIINSVYLCPQVYLCLPNPKSMVFCDDNFVGSGFPNASMLPDRHTLSPWLGGGYRILCDVEPELSPRGLCRKMLQTFKKETNMGVMSAFEVREWWGGEGEGGVSRSLQCSNAMCWKANDDNMQCQALMKLTSPNLHSVRVLPGEAYRRKEVRTSVRARLLRHPHPLLRPSFHRQVDC